MTAPPLVATLIRTMQRSGTELGVTVDKHGVWFVADRLRGRDEWSVHCGPFTTQEQATDWIWSINGETGLWT